MRIAFIVTSFPTLSTTFILNQITGLLDRGHEIDIYAERFGDLKRKHPDVERYRLLARTHCPRMPRNLLLRMLKGPGLLVTEGWKNPAPLLRSLNVARYGVMAAFGTLFYAALPLLGKRSYDIIHGHFGPNGLKAAFLLEAGLLRGKLITTFHGYDVNVFPRRYGFSVYRRLFIRGDFYTANTSFTTGRAIDLGCPPERIVTLPVGVSLAKFPFAERKLERTGEIRILTVGTLIEVKGIEFGIRAVARLAHRRPMIRYQIVGDGPLLRPLGELARKLAIADRVEFLGALPEDQLRECYRQTHIFMLPGVIARSGAQEGQGLVLVEAQASGIPVIATRVGGIPQTVLDGDSAFLVPQRDVDALASKIRYLIEHPQRWPEIGRAGRRHVERHFDIEKLNDRLVDIYRKVLDETPL